MFSRFVNNFITNRKNSTTTNALCCFTNS